MKDDIKKNQELGKGIEALIRNSSTDKEEMTNLFVDISKIIPNKKNPRQKMNKEKLEELKESIYQHGILQPLTVRKSEDDKYELIAGGRRFEAMSQLAQEYDDKRFNKVPVFIKNISAESAMTELALIENLQRSNLNPIEEAEAYALLKSKHNLTQQEISKNVGKSRSVIANSLRLLNLPAAIRKAVKDKKITAGHARALSSLSRSTQILYLFEKIVKLHLSVRKTEELVSSISSTKKKNISKKQPKKSPVVSEVENNLIHILGTKVKIILNANKKGKLQIDFFSKDDLDN